jgi:hypothetical protein
VYFARLYRGTYESDEPTRQRSSQGRFQHGTKTPVDDLSFTAPTLLAKAAYPGPLEYKVRRMRAIARGLSFP